MFIYFRHKRIVDGGIQQYVLYMRHIRSYILFYFISICAAPVLYFQVYEKVNIFKGLYY
jgi:hypothetical protein